MRLLTTIAALLALAASAFALDVGAPAPSLKNVTWVKGQGVTTSGKITVVEFWATWCGPCIKTIPHLTELQKKYGDKIQIAGLSNEDKPTVLPFVEKMGEKMDYHVGLIDEATHGAYMQGVDGIPHAFLVDANGTVMWQGHPATMDGTLAKMVNGTFDPTTNKTIAKAEKELEQMLQGREPNIDGALAKIDEILALETYNQQAISLRLAIAKYKKDAKMIRSTFAKLPLSGMPADVANSLAWARITEEDLSLQQLDLAIPLIKHAIAMEPNSSAYLDTQARLFYSLGLVDRAIATQELAVKATGNSEDTAATLAFYQSIKSLSASIDNPPAATPNKSAPAAIP